MPNMSAMPNEIAETGSLTKLPGPMMAWPMDAAVAAVLPSLSARSVLIATAPANMASGLKPKCHITDSAMNVAPPSSRPALMICTQVVAVMPPNST